MSGLVVRHKQYSLYVTCYEGILLNVIGEKHIFCLVSQISSKNSIKYTQYLITSRLCLMHFYRNCF